MPPRWEHLGGGLVPARLASTGRQAATRNPGADSKDDCHLYLWAANNLILRSGELVEAVEIVVRGEREIPQPKINRRNGRC